MSVFCVILTQETLYFFSPDKLQHVSKKQLTQLLLFFVAITLLSYYHRCATGDDAWFAEQSYWLEKEGIIRSELFRGLLGWEKQLLVSHKLFLAFGAALIRLFGYHLPVLQFTSLIFFVILIIEIALYIRSEEKNNVSWYLIAVFVLVFSNRIIIKMSFENRPEIMLAALGFGSFLLISKMETRSWKAIIAGILAGLAVLTHLNGVIYVVAGAGLLFYLRQYRQTMAFTLSAGIVSLVYFADIITAKNGISIWMYQFVNDPATQMAFGLRSKLYIMATYPVMFFHSPEQVALSLLVTFLLWHQRKFLKLLPVTLSTYMIILTITFWLITKKNTGVYLTLFLPFMFVLSYELYKVNPFQNLALKLILVAYFIIGIYGTGQIIHRNLSIDYLPVSYKALQKEIPDHANGFVPLTFFFNEARSYPHLLSHENFKIQCIMAKSRQSPENMARWAKQNNADFIVMDYVYRPEAFYPKKGTRKIMHYNLTFFDGRFAIYQLLKNKIKLTKKKKAI